MKHISLLTITLLLSACDFCGNEIYQKITSPDNKSAVFVFSRDCGATSGFSTQLSILNSDNDSVSGSGNILIIDNHPHENILDIEWISEKEIIIKGLKSKKIFLKESQYKEIVINYAANS